MLKKLLIAFLILIVLLLGIGFLLPSDWDVQRSVVINAPASAIYPVVATLRTWPEWTYWNHKRDPKCEWSFEGPETGPGSIMKWDGKTHLRGSLTIDRGDPATGIEYTLEMPDMTPMKGSIAFAAEGSGTRVTWRDSGKGNGMPWSNWTLMLLADPVMGGFFEESLGNLKTRVEEAAGAKAVEASAEKDKNKENKK